MSKSIGFVHYASRWRPARCCTCRFPERLESVKAARDWLAARFSASYIPQEAADSALLLLSELATNSLRHTAESPEGGAFRVRVFCFRYGLRVEVRDGGAPFTPVLKKVSPDTEHGRGLLLVESLADRWGRCDSARGSGMFFELRWPQVVRKAAG